MSEVQEEVKTEWRDVPGYPGFEASSLGEIRRDGEMCKKSAPCKGFPYHSVGVPVSMTGSKQAFEVVHKLVLLTFHGPRPPGKVAIHIDGNPQNDRADNLRWGTRREVRRRNFFRGTGRSPLSATEVLAIRDDFDAKFPQGWKNPLHEWARETSKRYKVPVNTCREIATRQRFKRITHEAVEGYERVKVEKQ